jgi:hypothetical protein
MNTTRTFDCIVRLPYIRRQIKQTLFVGGILNGKIIGSIFEYHYVPRNQGTEHTTTGIQINDLDGNEITHFDKDINVVTFPRTDLDKHVSSYHVFFYRRINPEFAQLYDKIKLVKLAVAAYRKLVASRKEIIPR